METQEINNPEKPYIKLYMNQSAKGTIYYNWEIKMYDMDVNKLNAKNEELKALYVPEPSVI
jgi:hypothetical protein